MFATQKKPTLIPSSYSLHSSYREAEGKAARRLVSTLVPTNQPSQEKVDRIGCGEAIYGMLILLLVVVVLFRIRMCEVLSGV